ncbi:MAG TPA: DNA polymerase ligase N-terminal domain-containing protein [Kofleriaceae bacterium]|nr:DNA polymerase ligase N-terminal domain-containing protein [Kofleriaceae bacterium]
MSAKLKYRALRDSSLTPEPSGQAQPARRAEPGLHYVIQAHAVNRLQYDLRLELDGVLVSWSVLKGPLLSPTARRFAVRTADHPVDDASVENVVPAGQDGGGTVVIWDQGRWQPEGDARSALVNGKLTFTLHGDKLTGRWQLIKMRSDGKAEPWLLCRDAAANDNLDLVTERPASVLSGRPLDKGLYDSQRLGIL